MAQLIASNPTGGRAKGRVNSDEDDALSFAGQECRGEVLRGREPEECIVVAEGQEDGERQRCLSRSGWKPRACLLNRTTFLSMTICPFIIMLHT